MLRIQRITGILLLALLVTGGLIAPGLHQLEHARDLVRRSGTERLVHAGHAHTDAPAVETELPSSAPHLWCTFCLLRWNATSGKTSAPVPAAKPEALVLDAPASPLLVVRTHALTRGPPLG